MKKNILLIGFALLSVQLLMSQNFTLSGKVIDQQTKTPLEYCTISILDSNTNQLVEGGITNTDGTFSIEVTKGTYTVLIDYISFESKKIETLAIDSDKDLGTVLMEINTQQLENVVVVREKTEVEIRLDKRIYNVGKDLTIRGGTVSDVLDNVPSVTVDIEGNVALRGDQNVRILINGKPSSLVGVSGGEALRQLPAESIDKVEVITSPSARYEAEGSAGIINIILVKNKFGGFNGSLSSNIAYPKSFGVSGNLNYRTKKYNLFLNSGYNNGTSIGNSYYKSEFLKPEGNDELIENRVFDRNRVGWNTNAGIEYFITEKSSFTTSLFLSDRDNNNLATNQLFSTDFGLETIETLRQEKEDEVSNTFEFNMNFNHNFNDDGHKLSIDFQKENSEEIEDGDVFVNEIAPNPNKKMGETVLTDETFDQILFQADYVNPFSESGQFEAGFRTVLKDRVILYELTNEVSSGNFEINTDLSNTLEYQENIYAVYSQYGNKVGKFSYFFGLRFEQTDITINQKTGNQEVKNLYGDLFPTINLSYELTDSQSITLGFNRRISRPRGRYINPFPSRSSATNLFQGNPNIQPSYSNGLDLGYLKRWDQISLNGSVYFTRQTDVFIFILEDTGDKTMVGETLVPILRRYPINLASQNRYGFELNSSASISKKWRVNGNINFFANDLKGSHNGKIYDKKSASWSGRLSNTLTLPKKIDWQTNVFYRGPREDAQNKSKGFASVSTAISKEVLKDDGTITFRISDVFNSQRRRSNLLTENVKNYSEFQWREPSYTLNFTYRFNERKSRKSNRGESGGEGESFDF